MFMIRFRVNPNLNPNLSFIPNWSVIAMPIDEYIERPLRPSGWQAVKIINGIIACLKFGLSLLLMLVAMEFNPSLFLALVVGYLIGDYVFYDFNLDIEMGVHKPLFRQGGRVGSLIRRILCIPQTEVDLNANLDINVTYSDT
jgi:hypothetical protein